ncbi:MAG: hypothetical protein HY888_04435 [Deltaproteobacteria bacterium]|nr:hypothetical protein [Deltaproteobacteria bacterium]
MRLIFIFCMLIVAVPAFAVEPLVPEEFIGDWLPTDNACDSKLGIKVEKDSVTLFNGADSKSFGDLDICYSCEGGAQYSGEVVWLLPEFHSGNGVQFTVYFNANEEKGITVIQFEKKEKENIKKRFPLHDVKLRKCKRKT